MTPAEFESTLREDVARQILQGAVVGGFSAPAAMTDVLYTWAAERRGFSLLRLSEADLATPVADPTEQELQAFYDANIDRFTKPEAKRITYVALVPEEIAPEQPMDEAALKSLYDERIDEFVVPEKRLVERLVFPDENTAQTAKGRIDAGEPFETLVRERGLELDDIDLGDVDKAALGAAGDAVFALTEPGVVGPLPSDLGPALFRLNGILAAQETSFEEARESLAAEMQTDAARRAIADRLDEIDDLLAGGATLEDAAKEAGLTLATIDYVPGTEEGAEGILAHPDFRAAAETVAEGDFPEAQLLDDGTLVALRLDEIVPPAPIPFDEARADVDAAWRADALAKALSARAAEIKAAVEGGASLSGFGVVDVTREIPRDGFVEGAPQDFMQRLFEMEDGAVTVVEGDGFTGVVQLTGIIPAEATGEEAEAFRESIAIQAEQGIAQDAFSLFTDALSNEAGITLDQTAISAVNAQFN
jgi:peptidyl-prolyl cis-trans isomerase D